MGLSKSIVASVLVLVLSILTITAFQNCSQIKFSDIEENNRLAALEVARVGKDSDIITAGLSEMPEVKLVFVVDNSGTMKQNQLNLAQSFGAMFDGSSASLNRFDSTTYLLNTAQTLAPYQSDSEKAAFDAISSQQNNFSASGSLPKAAFESDYRTSTLNSGKIPGDNLGFAVKKTASPLAYEILPAPVLGQVDNGSDVSFSSSIKLKANSNVNDVENEFKNRLAIMNADRIPQVLQGNKYVPQNASIVDSESGLCSIARVLRNPAGFIEPGQFVSFTVVSDENDNDPKGERCVQSVRELTGTEKLIDLECKKNQTVISRQTPETAVSPTQCKTNGNIGYTYSISYTKPDFTTVEYSVPDAAAKYTARFYNLKYKKVSSTNYSYRHTKVLFYLNECFDVYSDGSKIGTRCQPKSNPEAPQYKLGILPAGQSCLDLAKSYNANALAVPAPVCTTEDRSVATCDISDSLCKTSLSYADVTAAGGPFAGEVPAASACTAKAQTFADFAKDAVCVNADKTGLASCTGQPVASNCFMASAATTKIQTRKPAGNIIGSDNCVTWIKANYSDYSGSSPSVKTCSYTAAASANYTSSINFIKNGIVLDGGNQIAKDQPCSSNQAVNDAIFSAAINANANIRSTDSCTITGTKLSTDKTVTLTLADCNAEAAKRCTTDSLRSCTATTIASTTSTTAGAVTAYKTVPEKISCNSTCAQSVMGVCDAGTPGNTLISDFLISKFGAGTVCSQSTSVIETGKKSFTAQLESQKDSICKPDVADNAPTYPYVTKSTYYSQQRIVDYVAGTTTDSSGKSVPAMDLISYIQSRIAEMKANQFVFSALIQKSSDPAPAIGSQGVEYEKLSAVVTGKVDSVRSADYSVALKDLSQIIKDSLERTFVIKKMRPDQRINQVTWISKDGTQSKVVPDSMWSKNGNAIKVSDQMQFAEGDKFQVDFQNDVD
ncbi:MAG: hypothetical protein K0R29_2042 [Pseudobdellovibrio sp.]|nr:hypothetical protein [Pseudobdellovibrio sp.]